MQNSLEIELKDGLNFGTIASIEVIQELWSGYGSLLRVYLSESEHKSVIVKRIASPSNMKHPRGWNSDMSHQRKMRSYQIESYWYTHYNHLCNDQCRTPRLLYSKQLETHSLLVLEDLNAAGFGLRKNNLNSSEIKNTLSWLANFHATFLHHEANGLWPIGTYWQLETRPDEWKSMEDGALKDAAKNIHNRLNQAKYQTLVHGDAKYANFCFSPNGAVAAVDFQYVGKGCGIKDVIYLLSCISGGCSTEHQSMFLAFYFDAFEKALSPINKLDFSAIEKEWRELYSFAWADFQRFLEGWAPNHWKATKSMNQQTKKSLKLLGY